MALQQNVKTDATQVEKEYKRAVKELSKGNDIPLKSFAVVYSDLPLAQDMVKDARDTLFAKNWADWIAKDNGY